jgi:hypothetical protein
MPEKKIKIWQKKIWNCQIWIKLFVKLKKKNCFIFKTSSTNFYTQEKKRLAVKKIDPEKVGKLSRFRRGIAWLGPAAGLFVISLTPSKYPYSLYRGGGSVLHVRRTCSKFRFWTKFVLQGMNWRGKDGFWMVWEEHESSASEWSWVRKVYGLWVCGPKFSNLGGCVRLVGLTAIGYLCWIREVLSRFGWELGLRQTAEEFASAVSDGSKNESYLNKKKVPKVRTDCQRKGLV